ncbi:MarR family transcriptional regulator [Rubrobacter taiwanensis]|jgi:DNA-binding transcriptional regulator GbsR (MarR family)|uniref:MarR family transcriptional regulator n=1 Tax=Rubrobacter taiwanensis TaxID=185139 RepID=A0A4R1BR40_9ACTN|nr:MarR family transcriptional regulator [Rubrobacter taiwanensis]TCJ20058.1 MarR family transcriptional regulator [Rubrobacter taiwanensis]
MEEEKLEYIEEFGLFFERVGGSRMLGRVLGALMISEPPELSAGELARILRASRGSISAATRTLEQMGMIRRFTRPGERRDYFSVRPHAWEETVRRQAGRISEFVALAERGLKLLDPATPDARESLEEMRDFYAFWEKQMGHFMRLWEEEKRRGRVRKRTGG